MTLHEAQNIAFRLANLNSKKVTLEEIYSALVVFSNYYEDTKYFTQKKGKNETL